MEMEVKLSNFLVTIARGGICSEMLKAMQGRHRAIRYYANIVKWKTLFSETSFHTRNYKYLYKRQRSPLWLNPIPGSSNSAQLYTEKFLLQRSWMEFTKTIQILKSQLELEWVRGKWKTHGISWRNTKKDLHQVRTVFINFNLNMSLTKILNWKQRT